MQLLSPTALGGPRDYLGDDNYWETVFSIGLVPLILAVVGAWRRREGRDLRPWIALVVATAVFATGKQLGLYTLAYSLLPGMNRFRVPARTLFLASLSASVLVGAGWEHLLKSSGRLSSRSGFRRLPGTLAALVILAMLAGSALPSLPTGSNSTLKNLAESSALWLGVAGMAALWLVIGLGGVWRTRAVWGLGLLAVLELAVSAEAILVVAPVSAFLENDPLKSAILRGDRGDDGPLRIATFGTLYPDLRAAALGLEKTNINDSFQIQHAADLYQRLYPVLDPARPRRPLEGAMDHVVEDYRAVMGQAVLNLMGVRRVVTDRPLHLRDTLPLAVVETIDILDNRGALPRAYVVPRTIGVRRPGAERRIRLDEFAPREEVVMLRDPLRSVEGARSRSHRRSGSPPIRIASACA